MSSSAEEENDIHANLSRSPQNENCCSRNFEYRIVEGHTGEDIGQDRNQLSGEVARVSPKNQKILPTLLGKQRDKCSFDKRIIFILPPIPNHIKSLRNNYHALMLAAVLTNQIEGADNCDESPAASVALLPRIDQSERCLLLIDQSERCVSAGSDTVVLCRPTRPVEIISDDNSSK